MPKYKVVIHYEGALDYFVQAENSEQAERIALSYAQSEDNDFFAGNLADMFIADCYETR